MKNPFFRATCSDGRKVDINLTLVSMFAENEEGCTIYFSNGEMIAVKESAQTVRGRTRKTWPDDQD